MGHSSRAHKATENRLIYSDCQGVTKRNLADDLRDLGFTVSLTEDQSSRVSLPCSNKVRSTWAGFSFTKTSFQESEYDDNGFRLKRMHTHHFTVPRQGNPMAEMPDSLTAST